MLFVHGHAGAFPQLLSHATVVRQSDDAVGETAQVVRLAEYSAFSCCQYVPYGAVRAMVNHGQACAHIVKHLVAQHGARVETACAAVVGSVRTLTDLRNGRLAYSTQETDVRAALSDLLLVTIEILAIADQHDPDIGPRLQLAGRLQQ